MLGDGAHLVGQSYGAIVCLLAASHRPDSVRSLAVIEPPALALVRGNETVEKVIDGLCLAYAQSKPEQFCRAFVGTLPGEAQPELNFTPKDIAAIRTAMAERPPWEAEIPLDVLATATFPKPVAFADVSCSLRDGDLEDGLRQIDGDRRYDPWRTPPLWCGPVIPGALILILTRALEESIPSLEPTAPTRGLTKAHFHS